MFTGGGRQEENDWINDKAENPLAVWIRNVPVWLTEDRFYNEISTWPDCDVNSSHWFKNKQDNSWVGIRYGWAIVSFNTTRARNSFLTDENKHFVRNSDDQSWEKLKVSPWFDKQKPKPVYGKVDRSPRTVPLYKSDLVEREGEYEYEEFSRNCTENSIQAYKGKIHSYQGSVGLLEVSLVSQYGSQLELVIFHIDSIWLDDKNQDIETVIKPGTEVSFNARRLPQGLVKGRRFQAKSIWVGQDTQPNYITAPSTRRLDDWLALSKTSTTDSDHRSSSVLSNSSSSGKTSPVHVTTVGRQKPLKGGLNQLNSSQEKVRTTITVKKSPPTNFAQAVASVPSVIREDHSNLVLANAKVESILSEVEATISVADHGSFTLHLNQLDLDYKPQHGISRYLVPNRTTVTVTLQQTGKNKFEVVRAHINEEGNKAKYEDNFDPFEYHQKVLDVAPAAADSWEELDDTAYEPIKIEDDASNSTNDIDIDELDKYYDELQSIINFLENELPKVIPKIANDEKCFHSLAYKILAGPRSSSEESKELHLFLDHHSVPDRIKNLFITEFLKFRKFPTNPIKNSISPTSMPQNTKSAFEEAKEIFQEPIENGMDFKKYKQQTIVLTDGKIKARVDSFLQWLQTVVKNREVLEQKKQLYSAILDRPTTLTKIWYDVTLDSTTKHFISFITVSKLGEQRFTKLQRWVTASQSQNKGCGDWATFVTWLESDTNLFRMEEFRDSDTKIKSAGTVKKSDSGTLNKFSGLDLSGLELEFAEHQEAMKETSAFILRSIVFLRRSEVRLSGLLSLHLRAMEESGGKARPRDFQHKVQALMDRQCQQKVLDETNQWVNREGAARMGKQEHVPISHRRLDKFTALLSQSITAFFFARGDVTEGRREEGRAPRSPSKKLESEGRGEKEKREEKDQESVEVVNNNNKMEPNASGSSTSGGGGGVLTDRTDNNLSNFSDSEFAPFSCWLELALASGRVVMPSTATVEGVLWCLQARNISHSTLQTMWAGGSFGWQLRVSQLNLQPPLGVTVPDIADWLSAYFGSLTNTVVREEQLQQDGKEEITARGGGEEDALVIQKQQNLYSQYEDAAALNYFRRLKRSSLATREEDMIKRLEDVFSSSYLYDGTAWPHDFSQFDFSPISSVLAAGIWDNISMSSSSLLASIRDVQDGRTSYKKVLKKWARMLETSTTLLPNSTLDILTLLRATMSIYDESMPEKELEDLWTDCGQYNVCGLVTTHITSVWYAVQSRQAVILCHLETSYCSCDSGSCTLASCFPLGQRVKLHGCFPSKERKAPVASMVWTLDDDTGGGGGLPPETGLLLPVSTRVLKELYKTAPYDKVECHNSVETNLREYNKLIELHYNTSDFRLEEMWPGMNEVEMQKMFVFSQMGGMARPLLRSKWAAWLNTTDQEKERILNETFLYFERDPGTKAMMEFIAPIVEREGLRKAMKIMNQEFSVRAEEEEDNDTDSEKRRRDLEREEEEENQVEKDEEESNPVEDSYGHNNHRNGSTGVRNSTDTIKDETLWEAETNLEQLWGDEEGDRTVRRPPRRKENKDQEDKKEDGTYSLLSARTELMECKMVELEAGLASWQPMVGDMIGGNRELIMQLNSRIEFLENALNQITVAQSQSSEREASQKEEKEEEIKKTSVGTSRHYVKIAREGAEDEVAEVPTNSEGHLPMQTVKALYEGTSAIKYRVEGRGTWRALLLEAELYHAPEEDGWGDRVYICAQPQGWVTPRDTPPAAPASSIMESLPSFPLSASPWGLPSAPHIWGHTTSIPGHTPSIHSHGHSLQGQQFPYSGLTQSNLAKFLPNLPK